MNFHPYFDITVSLFVYLRDVDVRRAFSVRKLPPIVRTRITDETGDPCAPHRRPCVLSASRTEITRPVNRYDGV